MPNAENGAHTGCGACGARTAQGEPHRPDCPRVTPPEAIGDPEAIGEASIRFIDEHPLRGTHDIQKEV